MRLLRGLFRDQRKEAVALFLERGFSPTDAQQAASELWLACRVGLPTPPWIIDRMRSRPYGV